MPPDLPPSPALMALLDELSNPALVDPVRRIPVLRRALELTGAAQSPWLSTQLRLELGHFLTVSPPGDLEESLEEAVALFEGVLAHLPGDAPLPLRLNTLGQLGQAYVRRRRGERAENVERALRLFEEARGLMDPRREPIPWAHATLDLASAYGDRIFGQHGENLERSIALYQECLRIFHRQATPLDWAEATRGLASAYARRPRETQAEDLDRAIDLYGQALEVLTRQDYPGLWAIATVDLAHTLAQRTHSDRAVNLERAITCYEAALEVLTPRDNPGVWAHTASGLANALMERIRGDRTENLERAIDLYQQALTTVSREDQPLDWARLSMNLGMAWQHRLRGDRADNLERAIRCYEDALAIQRTHPASEPWVLEINLGTAYAARVQGDRAENLERAIGLYREVLAVVKRGELPRDWAGATLDLATAYRERLAGNRDENLRLSREAFAAALEVWTPQLFPLQWALAVTEQSLTRLELARRGHAGERDPARQDLIAALALLRPEAFPDRCRSLARLLGDLESEDGRWDEAVRAYGLALQAAEILHDASLLRTHLEVEASFTGDLYPRAAYALARAGREEEAVMVLERGRARGLGAVLSRERGDLAGIAAADPEAYTRLRQAVQDLRRIEEEDRSRGLAWHEPAGRQEGLEDLARRAREANRELAAAVERIRRLPGYEGFLVPPGLEDVLAAASLDRPLVYLNATPLGSLALLVSGGPAPGRVEPVWLDGFTSQDVVVLLAGAPGEGGGGFLPAQGDPRELDRRLDQEILPRLGAALIGPLASRLRRSGARAASLIVGGPLALLPLHAARYDHAGRETFLLDELDVSYAPSARALAAARAALEPRDARPPCLTGAGDPGPHPRPLPYARAELEECAALCRQAEPEAAVRPLYGEEATRDALLASLPGATHLHLACHSTFDFEDPLRSRLDLAGGEVLSLREAAGSPHFRHLRLVCLSACQSGLSEHVRIPDESLGLPAAFLEAGAPGVLATLWPVHDLSTALWASRFYELHLLGDAVAGEGPLPPATALARAQRWLREVTVGELVARYAGGRAGRLGPLIIARLGFEPAASRPFASPWHWAPFYLTGV